MNGGTVRSAPLAVQSDACLPLTDRALDQAAAEQHAKIFAALGDPVRLRLLSIIHAGSDTCSCHLEGPLDKSQPTISHHTRVLAEVGLIFGEKRGRWTYWNVAPKAQAFVDQLLNVSGTTAELLERRDEVGKDCGLWRHAKDEANMDVISA